MIRVDTSGSSDSLIKSLQQTLSVVQNSSTFDKYGRIGVKALAGVTPSDTGKTADAWRYRVIKTKTSVSIEWYNVNTPHNLPLALMLRYGHATRGGGYVNGKDYITPAMRPIFLKLIADVRKEVMNEFRR